MERVLSYTISSSEANLTISDFLKSKGFSSQNIIELKKIYNCSFEDFFDGLDTNV